MYQRRRATHRKLINPPNPLTHLTRRNPRQPASNRGMAAVHLTSSAITRRKQIEKEDRNSQRGRRSRSRQPSEVLGDILVKQVRISLQARTTSKALDARNDS